MKKIALLITLVLLAGGLLGQTRLNRGTTKIITQLHIIDDSITGGDTSFTYIIPDKQHYFSASGHWTHSGGEGYLYIDVSNDNNIWARFDATATDTMTSTDTTFLFDSNSIPLSWQYLRMRFDTTNSILRNFYITIK